jgi:hypothetical protein
MTKKSARAAPEALISQKPKQSSLLKEVKRDASIVFTLLILVLLLLGWNEMIVPPLSIAFTDAPNQNEVKTLLMILGSLVIMCLLLATILVAVLVKIGSITKKLDSLHLLVIPIETPSKAKRIENEEPGAESTD